MVTLTQVKINVNDYVPIMMNPGLLHRSQPPKKYAEDTSRVIYCYAHAQSGNRLTPVSPLQDLIALLYTVSLKCSTGSYQKLCPILSSSEKHTTCVSNSSWGVAGPQSRLRGVIRQRDIGRLHHQHRASWNKR